jgi:hypothetical protein
MTLVVPEVAGFAMTITHDRENERGDEMTDRQDVPFQLEEATIADLHEAIRAGKTTVVQVVQHYINRARAYNGVASLLLTEDGAPIPEAVGTRRAPALPHRDRQGFDNFA